MAASLAAWGALSACGEVCLNLTPPRPPPGEVVESSTLELDLSRMPCGVRFSSTQAAPLFHDAEEARSAVAGCPEELRDTHPVVLAINARKRQRPASVFTLLAQPNDTTCLGRYRVVDVFVDGDVLRPWIAVEDTAANNSWGQRCNDVSRSTWVLIEAQAPEVRWVEVHTSHIAPACGSLQELSASPEQNAPGVLSPARFARARSAR